MLELTPELTHGEWRARTGAPRLCGDAFVGGRFVKSASGETFASINPATGEKLADIASCDSEDVDRAIGVARAAFGSGCWHRSAPAHRKKVLIRLADLMRARWAELALLDSLSMGKLVRDAATFDVPDAADVFQWYGVKYR